MLRVGVTMATMTGNTAWKVFSLHRACKQLLVSTTISTLSQLYLPQHLSCFVHPLSPACLPFVPTLYVFWTFTLTSYPRLIIALVSSPGYAIFWTYNCPTSSLNYSISWAYNCPTSSLSYAISQ